MGNPYWPARPVPPVFSDPDVPVVQPVEPEPAVKALFGVWQWQRGITEWLPEGLMVEIKCILLQHYTEDQLTSPKTHPNYQR